MRQRQRFRTQIGLTAENLSAHSRLALRTWARAMVLLIQHNHVLRVLEYMAQLDVSYASD